MYEIDKTRKHFVPILYLRGFCTADCSNQIYVFDKDDPKAGVVKRSIKKVEVSRDAYSVVNDEILKQREHQWSELLKALKGVSCLELNEFISNREQSAALRAGLARFVVDSKLRSRGFREQIKERVKGKWNQHRKSLAEIEADFRARYPELEERWAIVFPLLREIIGIDNDRKFDAIHIDPFLRGEEGEEQYKWHEEGSWRFDKALGGREFITSDIPSTSVLLGPEAEYRNLMFFFMPLSADLQLMGMCGEARRESGLAPRLTEMSERGMDLTNLSVFKNADRFVYSSSKAEILRAIEQSAS